KANYVKALSELSEKQRTVFLMARMEGLKYREIAERLNISIKAVEKRMSITLAYLKKALQE
ncbi:MAG: RNA polymerase sigma-70 factor, partial [Bacteroidales bacterium]